MNIEEYLIKWKDIEGVKPKNEDEFITLFVEYLNSIDNPDDVDFDGSGAYFGRQVTICKDLNYRIRPMAYFEIAYDFEYTIRVYTARHEGYWTPEYIDLKIGEPRFNEVREALMNCLCRAFGLIVHTYNEKV